MSRHALNPGEYGEVNVSLIRKDGSGKWKVVSGARRGGDRYRAKLYYRDHGGKASDKSAMRERKGDAIDAVVTAVENVLREVEYFGPSTSLIAVGKQWLEQIERDGKLKERSRSEYATGFNLYIDSPSSGLQGLSLSQANDPQRIRRALQVIADERGEATAQKVKTILSNIFQHSIDSGVLTHNGTKSIRRAKAKVKKASLWETDRSFSDAEVVALMAHVDLPTEGKARKGGKQATYVSARTERKRESVADLLAMLLGTGARVGEVCALRWNDLDLETGALYIRKSKTDAGIRRNDLNPELLERIRRRAKSVGTEGLIFPAPGIVDNPEREWGQANRDRSLRKAFDSVGLTWAKAHTCRHTVITKLAESGVPYRRIADTVGDENVDMTMKYLGKDFGAEKGDISAHLVYSK